MTGTIGPFTVATCRPSMRAKSPGGSSGSAMMTAAGLTADAAAQGYHSQKTED